MPFYAFRFDAIKCNNPRGKLPCDNDVVTFSVFVNQIDRGHGANFFVMCGGETVNPGRLIAPNNRAGAMGTDWIVGPLELVPDDLVSIVYSGTNTSDSQLTLETQQQDQIEIKILDTIYTAAAGAIIGGPIGSAISAVLGAIGDPVGKLLNVSPQGPCNGLVFSDAVQFTGAGLASQSFQPSGSLLVTLPQATEAAFTRSYTDETTHDTSVCGKIAHTDITFSVLQLPSASVRSCASHLFPTVKLSDGLRHATGSNAASLRSLIGLRQ